MTLPGLVDRANALSQLPGLGLLTLAGMMPPTWSCSYRDDSTDLDSLVDAVLSENPDLVAVSALTASIEEAYQFSARIRAQRVPVAMGGLHVTACPDEAQRFADIVVIGEGEAVWPQLLADVERGSARSRYDAATERGAVPWAKPRFDLLARNPSRFTLQTQRGCPFACEFCGASRLLGSFREKPVELIAQELDAIKAIMSRPLLELADDNTFAGVRDPVPLFEAFENAEVRYFTESDWRIGERPELLRGLAKSGCVQVLVGIESIVFRYPGMGTKAVELERMLDAVHAIQDAGVVVNGCFILGADGETDASVRVNLWLLAIVATWRVILITRCASVLLGARYGAALVIVMLFADVLVLAILAYTPMPIFNIMGGIRLTESEELILGAAFLVKAVGILTLPIWFVCTLSVLLASEPPWTPLVSDASPGARVSGKLWLLAGISILIWIGILPYSQPPQQLKRRVGINFAHNDFAGAVRLMAKHDRNDFPASWDPPPWPGYGQDEPPLSLVLMELIESDIQGWVRDLYVDKFLQTVNTDAWIATTGSRSKITSSGITR
jgi:hypothetical protein